MSRRIPWRIGERSDSASLVVVSSPTWTSCLEEETSFFSTAAHCLDFFFEGDVSSRIRSLRGSFSLTCQQFWFKKIANICDCGNVK